MKRGPYNNRKAIYEKAIQLRMDGYGYRTIANIIGDGISHNVIKNWVKDIKVSSSLAYQLSRPKPKELDQLKTNPARRKYLIKLRGHMCERCMNTEWQGMPIPIELEHINGIRTDNNLSNLKLLCPNCHALTDTYKGKNIKKYKKSIK